MQIKVVIFAGGDQSIWTFPGTEAELIQAVTDGFIPYNIGFSGDVSMASLKDCGSLLDSGSPLLAFDAEHTPYLHLPE